MYENGLGTNKDESEAVRWWRIAAEHGDAVGQSNLGQMYAKGLGVLKDDVEAVRWNSKSAAQESDRAQNSLGYMYLNGLGIAKNYLEAVRWFNKAATKGNAYAQVNLGYMYQNGYGVAQSHIEAGKLYRQSAAQGNLTASANLQALESLLAANAQKQKSLDDAKVALRVSQYGQFVGNVIEVNEKYGFIIVQADKVVPSSARLLIEKNGQEFIGRAEKQTGSALSVTLDSGKVAMSLVGSRVYIQN